MSIENENHSGFDPETNVIEEDGDVKPYVSPLEPPDYLGNLPQPPQSDVPPEVQAVLYDAAKKEDKARARGYSRERIATKVHIPLNQALIRLQLAKIDTSSAFPPERPAEVQEPDSFTDDEERQMQILEDAGGKTRAEAENIVRGRRQ